MERSYLFKLLLFISTYAIFCQLSLSSTFTISNYCSETIWPGTLAGAGTPELSSTGFMLQPGQTARLQATPGWSGRIWARTGCQFDLDGAGICQTGDCGGRLECQGAGALPPATLFEVTLGKGTDEDFYDVSLVDGYNLPVVVIPRVQHGTCNATGCIADLNQACPKELQVDCGEGVIACRSACEAFGRDEFCCSGQYGNPSTCRPTRYSAVFKAACPRAYSYAYDDSTSTFTCAAAFDYTIAFCPPTNAMKRSDGTWVGSTPPPENGPTTSSSNNRRGSTANGAPESDGDGAALDLDDMTSSSASAPIIIKTLTASHYYLLLLFLLFTVSFLSI
ncbi:hypothetical protein LUZ62_026409 [Rhynchospora pubera]|uniref:Thaumatin-like protein n=1 Tax=Rhynchospora pubera TaxID=906938 RepID=A0AAV8CYX0_9POAL|nr:hypothetical protein LUZ62_071735 [Rhynchospora pubera]KAJ4813843.1 hypothetical protein LUZ62_026409 [Rhynchospora pubera]